MRQENSVLRARKFYVESNVSGHTEGGCNGFALVEKISGLCLQYRILNNLVPHFIIFYYLLHSNSQSIRNANSQEIYIF